MGSQTSVAPAGSPGANPAPSPIVNFVPLLVVLGILYFILIRPQQKQAREHKRMIDNLKAGDRVVTQGGLCGTVAALKAGIVQLKIADNVRVDVLRSAVSQVVVDSPAEVSTTTGDSVQ